MVFTCNILQRARQLLLNLHSLSCVFWYKQQENYWKFTKVWLEKIVGFFVSMPAFQNQILTLRTLASVSWEKQANKQLNVINDFHSWTIACYSGCHSRNVGYISRLAAVFQFQIRHCFDSCCVTKNSREQSALEIIRDLCQ